MALKSVKNPVWSYPEEEIWQATMDIAPQCRVLHILGPIVMAQVKNPVILAAKSVVDK